MTVSSLAAARELVAAIRMALDAAELEEVTATIDAALVPSGAREGVVLVGPPELTFPTFEHTQATWELHIVAGPATNYIAAWDRIDQIMQALATHGLPLRSAEPGQWQHKNNDAALPLFTVTLHPMDTEE